MPTLATFSSLLALTVILAASLLQPVIAAPPQLLAFYPKCDYTVIETVKINKKFSPEVVNNVNPGQVAYNQILQELTDTAKQLGAVGFIVTQRKTEVPGDNGEFNKKAKFHRLKLHADMIGDCDLSLGYLTKETPFDTSYIGRYGFQNNVTINIEMEYQFAAPEIEILPQPALVNSNISIQNGAFGTHLGNSKDEVIQLLGPPTFELMLQGDASLFVYGRKMFFGFEEGELTYISNKNHWFSYTFINLLLFDDRFDSNHLIIEDKIKLGTARGDKAFTAFSSSNASRKLQISKQNKQLLLEFEQFNDQSVLKFFTLQLNNSHFTQIASKITPTDIGDSLQQLVSSLSLSESMDLSGIKLPKLGIGWRDKRNKMALLSPHIVVVMRGSSIDKILLVEDIFSSSLTTQNSSWSFGEYKQGQTLAQVRQLAGDNVFEMDLEMEISAETYQLILQFYEINEKATLTSGEINLY